MKTTVGVLLAFLTLTLAPDLLAQTGWSVDRYEGFRASVNNTGTAVTQLGWTTGNLGNSWDEGEWVPYCLSLINVNMAAANFSDIIICYDFTKGNPPVRFIDLVRDIQVGTTGAAYFPLGVGANANYGWPMGSGAPYPLTTVPELNLAQKNQNQYVWGSGLTAWKLLNLPNTQVNRDPNGNVGTPTDLERCFRITKADLIAAGISPTYTGSMQVYFNLHLSQTFIWSLSLQSQFNTPPTNAWGGYLYGAAPFSTDARNGSGYVPGASGHTYLTQGNRTVSIPIPPAPVGEISGLKYYDANANSVRDVGEPVLEGWPIYISTIVGGNPISYTRITDSQGAYSLTGLPGAVYTVSEKHQGPKPAASPPPNYPYAAFNQNPPSTWDESYPPIPTSINAGAAIAVATTPAGIALGYAPESWAVDLITTTVQGNINFGNFVPPPQCEVTPSAATACLGDQVTFTAARIADGTPPYTVAWTGPNNFTASTFAITVTAGPLTAGTYTAVLTDANGLSIATGCSATLSLYPQPACTITGGPTAVCAFSSGHQFFGPLFNAPPVNIASWAWSVSGNGAIVGPANGQMLTVDATGSGSFTVVLTTTSVDGCSSTCSTTVTVNPLPNCMITNTDPVCPGATTVHGGPANMVSYVWTISGAGTINGSNTNPTVSVTAGNTNNTSYTLTLTVIDANGCQATCNGTVQVQDITPPNIGCANDQTINCPAPTVLPFTPPIVTDNCDPNPVVIIVGTVTVPGNCPQQYDVVRTWRATDAWGNSAQCSQTIHVVDVTPPVITVPPTTLTMQCYSASAVASWAATASAIDLCSGTVTPVPTWTAPTSNCNQTITVTFTATDLCGNSSTATKTFTVNDNTPPVITVPQANLTMECYNPGLVSSWAATASATDNCGGPVTLVPSWAAPVDNCNRTVTVTFTATDVCGNSSTATKTFLVNDVTPPVITCPAPVTVSCAADVPAPNTALVTATDNCAGVVTKTFVNDVISNQTCANRFTVTRTYMATDVCGNSATCTQIITVNDVTPPVITCPAPVLVSCAADVPAPNTTLVIATDNCAGTVTKIHVGDVISNQTCDNRFTVTRTYRATDVCGNSATCTQIITVNDVTPPVITCPAPVTVQCAADVPAPNTALVTATDNCAGIVTKTFVNDVISNQTCANRFTVTRTYRATDVCGNSATCTQIITVNDNTPPVITCPAPITVQCAADVPAFDLTLVIATDNCAGTVTKTHVGDVISNQLCANKYTLTRTYRATDVCGNSSTCTQIITVNDNTPPTITCPAPITVSCAADVPAANTALVIATDNCAGVVTKTHVGDVISNQTCANRFTVTRTYKATDVCGNSATCTQIITVNDVTPPVITCPAPVTVSCAADVPAANTTLVIATDNCAGVVTKTHVGDVISNQTCANRFTVTRTYRATDVCGNSATCTQIITVNDVTPPVITCPAPVTVSCAADVPAPNTALVTATDNCAGVVTKTHVGDVISNQTCDNRFTVTRTYRATDVCGNSATCTQIITVNDVTPPVITCPAPVTVQCATDVPAPNTALVTATDNCAGIVTKTFVNDVISNQTCANRFTVTRTYRATDVCGNSATCTQIITVNDNTPPVITCPAPVTVQCAALVPPPSITSVTATDNCGPVTVVHVGDVISNQTCANRYTITRTYKATDVCLNSSTCTQIITVNDNTPPVITVPPTNLTMQCYSASAVTIWAATASATDNCIGTVTLVPTWTAPVDNCNRTVTVTFTATDVCGNSSTATKAFLVNDTTPPTITCPAPVTVQCAADVPVPNTALVTATDNCAGPVVKAHVGDVISNQTCANRYILTRTYRATDGCGNSATCTQIITVNDVTPPVITCPAPLLVSCAADVPAPNTALVTATDNCTGVVAKTFVNDAISNQTCANRFTVTRTYRATDVCGNSATCTQIITVNDVTPPVITVPPTTLTMQCYSANDVATWVATASATDNCIGTVTLVPTWVAPVDNCNRTVTVTFTATDICGNSSTATKTFLVNDNTPPVVTVPPADLTMQCYDATAVAAWIATASALDNCDGSVSVASSFTPPTSNCNQTVTVTFTSVDACGNQGIATKTFTVNDTEAPQWINLPPTNIVVDCADPIVFWDPQLNTDYADNCDPLPTLFIKTDHMILPQPDGTKWHYRSWWVVDACQNWSDSVSQTIVELRCQFATLTQGAYGNGNGTWCATGQTRIPLLNTVLLTTPLTVGMPGHSFTIGIGKGACVVQYMPSGGPAAVLQSNDYYFGNNCNIVPGNFSQLSNGKFFNILLGQTITFALNLRLDPNLLTGIKLPPTTLPYMYTIQADYVNGICLDGDDVEMPLATPQAFYIPPSVITALHALYPLATDLYLPDLLALANRALAGQNTYGATLANITMALDAYNRGFDEARFFAGYWPTLPPKSNVAEVLPSDFQLLQNHPNPFNPSTTIEYDVPVSSEVHLAVYSPLGKLVAVLVDGQVREGRHSVVWNSSANGEGLPSGIYMYRLMATGEDGRRFASVKTMMLVK